MHVLAINAKLATIKTTNKHGGKIADTVIIEEHESNVKVYQ